MMLPPMRNDSLKMIMNLFNEFCESRLQSIHCSKAGPYRLLLYELGRARASEHCCIKCDNRANNNVILYPQYRSTKTTLRY